VRAIKTNDELLNDLVTTESAPLQLHVWLVYLLLFFSLSYSTRYYTCSRSSLMIVQNIRG